MARSDLERRTEQIREQIEDLRANLDDVLRNYNKLVAVGADWFASAQGQVSRAARQAKGNVEEVGEELAEAGVQWWVPVAVVAAIGGAIALAKMLGLFGTRESEMHRETYTPKVAGQSPPFDMAGQP